MVTQRRTILHVDLDAFFVSAELLSRPELLGEQVIVGYPKGRSVVLSASYEARKLGVRSAMPMEQAMRLAPKATIITPSHSLYSSLSKQVMELFRSFTPQVQQLSVDEAFLDVTGSTRIFGDASEIAKSIKLRLKEELGLPATVGGASTKFVAKIASTTAKPDGLRIIPHEETLDFLHALPIRALWGIGPVAGNALLEFGIKTIGDIAKSSPKTLKRILGEASGRKAWDLAHGIDNSFVETSTIDHSVGHERTYENDTDNLEQLQTELLGLSSKVGQRIRKSGHLAATISIKVKFFDFKIVTRSRTLEIPTDSDAEIYQTASELLKALSESAIWRKVRLIGVRAEQLTLPSELAVQLDIWDTPKQIHKDVDTVSDRIRDKFGDTAIVPARLSTAREPEKEG